MPFTSPSEPRFPGVIGRTIPESQPHWPDGRAPAGAPNVVMVVLDDTGFAHLGCYGSTIETPNIDRLASEGLRYTGFHTTALCSSSRACLLTGRNHHAVGIRAVSNMDTGYPNMRGAVTPMAATVAEVLRDNGFGTFAAGKWHLAPMAEATAAGPFRNWPLQKGFDRFYGFLQGETDQFHPELSCDNHFIDQPRTVDEGYHVSEDLVDQSIAWVRDQTSLVPERPFFLYLAFGAMHAPHQAPKSYLEKYRGRFDEGWDMAREAWFERQKAMGIVPAQTRLSPPNPGVQPWSELSHNERLFAARLQEAFAAMLDHTDVQIGRLVHFLEEIGVFDDTLFILVSDNGASQEGGPNGVFDEAKFFNLMGEDVDKAVERLDDVGGPESHCNIPWGWAQAGNSPLKWYKQNTHGGGVRDPLIFRWPARISEAGGLRHQFCHAIDVAPTILDIVGITPPARVAGVEQMPVHGVSLAPTFSDVDAPVARQVQYFEMLGHRGLWLDGWKAVTHHNHGVSFDEDDWELYHLDSDFSESNNLALAEPERLKAMIAAWWREAETHGVLPLDDRAAFELFRASRRPGLPTFRRRFVYRPPVSHIVADACPGIFRGWRMILDLEQGEAAEGALVSRGSLNGGFVLYIRDGRCVFDYNAFHHHTVIASERPLGPGRHTLDVSVSREDNGSGAVKMMLDDILIAEGVVPRLLFMISTLGMDLGRSPRPVSTDYSPPFAYTGALHSVVFELPPIPPGLMAAADQSAVVTAMSRQ
jgi:arylsulfatase